MMSPSFVEKWGRFVDYTCTNMLEDLKRLAEHRREAEGIRARIAEHREEQRLRREWIACKIGTPHHLEYEIEAFEGKIETEKRALQWNLKVQRWAVYSMEMKGLYRPTLLPQGTLVKRTDRKYKDESRFIEAQYKKYRAMATPTRIQPRRGRGVAIRYY